MRGSLLGLYNASQILQSGEIDSPNYIHSVGLHAQSMVDRHISWPKRYTIPPLGVKLALRRPLTDDTDMAEALPAGDVALGYLGSSAGVVLNGRCAIIRGCQIKSGNRREVSRRLPSRGCRSPIPAFPHTIHLPIPAALLTPRTHFPFRYSSLLRNWNFWFAIKAVTN